MNTEEIHLKKDEKREIVILQFDENDLLTDYEIYLDEPGAEIKVRGLYFANAGQQISNRIEIKHLAKDCKSDVLYKGVLRDKGTFAQWIGNVVIAAEATGTETYEENRNLLLTRGAKAESEPNLEILTGDIIKAGHASATGRLDDEQLFYLTSRGISPEDATKLVVQGFFASVLDELHLEDSEREKINQQIIQKLQ